MCSTLLLGLAALLGFQAAHGVETLAIIDHIDMEKTQSAFFDGLRGRGHNLTIRHAHDPRLALQHHGQYLFDNLILLCPSVEEFGGAVDVSGILQFVDSGRNLMLTASPELGDPMREVASESGVIFAKERHSMIDHIDFELSDFDGDHTLLVATQFENYPMILGSASPRPVFFEGIGMRIDPENSLAFKLLSGSATSYSASAERAITVNQLDPGGWGTPLITAMQARNNARIIFSGSTSLFSNSFVGRSIKYSDSHAAAVTSGNYELCQQVSRWCFGERGKLRWSGVSYGTSGATSVGTQTKKFRVGESVEFNMRVEEWNGEEWVPYIAHDIQLEFKMIDPWIRVNLTPDSLGNYKAQFQIPDQFGVYQFKVEYWRQGYSWINVREEVSVRPVQHHEHERFLLAACPYYASSFAVMAGTFVFGGMFLYYKPT